MRSFPLIIFFFLMSCSDAPNPDVLPSGSLAHQGTDEEIYQRGIQIMKTEGVKSGLAYFEGKPVTHQTIFGIGWVYWSDGTYDKAEEVCRYLIARKTDNNIKASVNYLMGYLHIQYTKYADAVDYFERAFSIYQNMDKPKDQFRTLLGLATAHFYLADYEEMKSLLNAAQCTLNLNDEMEMNLGQYHYLKARLAFSRQNYSGALVQSEKSYTEHVKAKDTESSVNAMIDISFYRFMNGQFDAGIEMAESARAIIVEHNLIRMSYLNTINFILAYRCSDAEYATDEKAVRKAAKDTNDKWMLATLEFVLSLNCQ